jgi:ribosomal subunit interface protein
MNLQFHIRGMDLTAETRQRLEQALGRMQRLTPVTAAAVVLEYERESAPAFRAFVLLAVPGPDIHAEARDHTLEAAWLKVTTSLKKQIERRKARLEARMKENGHLRATNGRHRRIAARVLT